MKKLILPLLPLLFVAFSFSTTASTDSSVGEKAVKAKILTNPNDSALKKATKVKVTKDIVTKEGDSAAKKAVKLKVVKDVSK